MRSVLQGSRNWQIRQTGGLEKMLPPRFKKLKSWIEIDDKYVRWNVAMSLGVRFGQAYPDEALKLLKELANDEERFVWRAASSSIVKLIRTHPELQKEVLLWDNCEECLNVVKKYI